MLVTALILPSRNGVNIPSLDSLRAGASCPCVSFQLLAIGKTERNDYNGIIEYMLTREGGGDTHGKYSAYSAHEHTTLYSNVRITSTAATNSSSALPLDIVIEALVSLFVVSTGLVLGAEKLKPISWSVWAGEIEKEGGGKNPYLYLEERYGFWDIRVSAIVTRGLGNPVECGAGWPASALSVLFSFFGVIYGANWDLFVKAKRKEFANWVRGEEVVATK